MGYYFQIKIYILIKTENICLEFRGKGDYYRLGHGTDEHVRRPKKVSGLQGKKIVSISTGNYYIVGILQIRIYFLIKVNR